MTYDEDNPDVEFCHCEDPYNVGHRLLKCGQAICLKLRGMLPTLAVVKELVIKVDEEK